VRAKALLALEAVAAAGAATDALLVQAELAQARASETDAQAQEEVVQTLNAMSREAWTAHAALLRLCRGVDQYRRLTTAAG
jgi:hypothetical protein